MPKLRLPKPKKPGPKSTCECGVCPQCLNRFRVMRKYYADKLGKDSPAYQELLNGQLH